MLLKRKNDIECCSKEITLNFGKTCKMICGQSNSPKEVIWLKNGDIIGKTYKTNFLSRYLHISCLESSDSGEYVCKDNVTSSNYIDSYRLTIRNPGMHTIPNYGVIVYTSLNALYCCKVKFDIYYYHYRTMH